MTASVATAQAYAVGAGIVLVSLILTIVGLLLFYVCSDGSLWWLVPGVSRWRYTPRHAEEWSRREESDDGGTAWLVGMGEAAA